MKIIVGLGNPGKQYDGTRHNVGYEVIAELAGRYWSGRPQVKHQAELAEFPLDGEKVLLVSPLTFMNLSGRSVRPLVDFYKLPLEHLMVISDDLSLPAGQLRIKAKGSSGGQKGIQSIIQMLGTQDFPRLRVGIDPTPERWTTSDYVLGKFDERQRPLIDQAVKKAADAIEVWIKQGITPCMNRYNVRPSKPKKKTRQDLPEQEGMSAKKDGAEAPSGLSEEPRSPRFRAAGGDNENNENNPSSNH